MTPFLRLAALIISVWIAAFAPSEVRAQWGDPYPNGSYSDDSQLDSAIHRFFRNDLHCSDAVSAFKAYLSGHPKASKHDRALATLMISKSFGGITGFQSECESKLKQIAAGDSEIYYLKQAGAIDPTVRSVDHDFTIGQMLGHDYGHLALWWLEEHQPERAADALRHAKEEGGFSKSLLEFARQTLNGVAPNGILFTFGDDDTFPLMELQLVEGIRRDVTVVNSSLIILAWYQRLMATGIEKYMTKLPILPDPAIGDGLDIPDTIYQQWAAEDRELTPEIYPIDANAREQLTSEAGDELPELPRTAAFHADTNQPDFAVSAHLLRQVVRTNRWIRPVYLAASGYPDHFNGIEPYLREEGFVARLFPDTGVDYDAQAQRWIDSTRFESSLRSAITMIPHSDGLVAGYLDGLFLGRETVTFFKWLDSSRSMDFLSLIRPIVRANATYPFTQTSVLYIDQYNKGHNELRSDLEWFSKAMSEELRQHPNEVPWYNFILAEDYAALKNCSELRALSDSTPNSNETWRRVKDLIQPLVDNCK